jgi:hypothetical protein
MPDVLHAYLGHVLKYAFAYGCAYTASLHTLTHACYVFVWVGIFSEFRHFIGILALESALSASKIGTQSIATSQTTRHLPKCDPTATLLRLNSADALEFRTKTAAASALPIRAVRAAACCIGIPYHYCIHYPAVQSSGVSYHSL